MPHSPPPVARPLAAVSLDFRTDPPELVTTGEPLRENLSVLEITGDCLWTASDETATLERLITEDGGVSFGKHRPFRLDTLFELPDPGGEIDIEGVAAAGRYLWVTGSMSLARKKPNRHETDRGAALERLTEVKVDPNRWLLGRIPCVPVGERLFALHREAEVGGERLEAACLKLSTKGGNALTKALRGDEHLARFLDIPAKENGFDVEGLAVVTLPDDRARVFLGLRGPVLRGWATLLELSMEPGKPGRLKLADIGSDGEPYRKHFLDLDGLGIRDLKVDGDDLLILAGPTMDLDGPVALWRWPGGATTEMEDVIPRDRLRREMILPHGEGFDHAEGMAIAGVIGDGRRRLLIAYDNPGATRCHPDGRGVDLDAFTLE